MYLHFFVLPLSSSLFLRIYVRTLTLGFDRAWQNEMTSLFRLSDSFHSEPEWMDYWSKFWDCGDVAVGRYQHAHAASTYSYTLALSRSPSPSSLLYSFLQPSYPLVLSPLHLPCLPSSHMSPFFFPIATLRSDHYSTFCLFLSLALFFSIFVILSFFPFFLKTLFIVFHFSHFHSHFSRFQFFHFFVIENLSFLDFLLSVFSARIFIIFIDIYGTIVIISLPQCRIYSK